MLFSKGETMEISKLTYDELSELGSAIIADNGKEINNPKPVVLHTGIKRPPTLQEQIHRVLRGRLSREAEQQGYETLEESQDFDVENEDTEPDTIYQVLEDEIPTSLMPNDEELANKEPDMEPGGSSQPPSGVSDPVPVPKEAQTEPSSEESTQ